MKVKELLEQRAKIIADARGVFQKAEDEKREPTTEEREGFDKMMAEAETLKGDITRMTTLEKEEREAVEAAGQHVELRLAADAAGGDGGTETPERFELRKSVTGEERHIVLSGSLATSEYGEAYREYLFQGTQEKRALQADSDTAGGYLSPLQFMASLIRKIDDLVFVRQLANVLAPLTNADSLGVPSLDADPADAEWTGEISTAPEDSTMSFGGRELKPHLAAKLLKISMKLIRSSAIPVDALVRDRLAYKMAITQEKAFLTGIGVLQPLGLFTANANGISTGRDVSTGNDATAPTFDGLKEAQYSVKAGYRQRASWIWHRDGIKLLSKLKDGEGRYIWVPSVQRDKPDLLLNSPFYESEYAPNTFTASQYVGIYGDMSQYWIVDALTLTIQVLMELYARTNQIGYIARSETDGMPVLEEAFARVKLAAS